MTFAADSVSATPFRGGSATLNPPLGHSKARETQRIFSLFFKRHLIRRGKPRHLLPPSRRRRPSLLRKSVNSPLEKAGENPCFRQRTNSTHARHTYICGSSRRRPLQDKIQIQSIDKIKSPLSPIVAHTKNSAQFLCKITKCKFVLKKDRLFHIFIV